MNIHTLSRLGIAYTLLPYKRNQDVIKIFPQTENAHFVASIVDGFNFRDKIPGNTVGRKAAQFIAETYPEIFLQLTEKDYYVRAKKAAFLADEQFLTRFPRYVSAVGVFIFAFETETVIVALGTIKVWTKKRGVWLKPKQIGDYFLPYPKYYSGSRSLFGFGEVKHNPFYHVRPDVVVVKAHTSILVATDGLDDVMNLDDLNRFTQSVTDKNPEEFVKQLLAEIKRRKTQKDDIALFCGSRQEDTYLVEC